MMLVKLTFEYHLQPRYHETILITLHLDRKQLPWWLLGRICMGEMYGINRIGAERKREKLCRIVYTFTYFYFLFIHAPFYVLHQMVDQRNFVRSFTYSNKSTMYSAAVRTLYQKTTYQKRVLFRSPYSTVIFPYLFKFINVIFSKNS